MARARDLTDDEREYEEEFYKGLTRSEQRFYRWTHPDIFHGPEPEPEPPKDPEVARRELQAKQRAGWEAYLEKRRAEKAAEKERVRQGLEALDLTNPEPKPPALHPENLTPWKPGQSGNPAGVSKKRKRLTEELNRQLDRRIGLERRLINAGIEAALAGDFNFWKYIFERCDGKLEAEDRETPPPVILRVPPGARLRDGTGDGSNGDAGH